MVARHRNQRNARTPADLPQYSCVAPCAAGLRVQTASAARAAIELELRQRALRLVRQQRRVFPGGRPLGHEEMLVHLAVSQL